MGKSLLRNILLVFAAIAVSAAICVVAIIILMGVTAMGQNQDGRFAEVAAPALMDELTEKAGVYTLSETGKNRLVKNGAWAMLLDGNGAVVGAKKSPQTLPIILHPRTPRPFRAGIWATIR